jgi:glyoxylase-like metal-dependent hydrolase (beta-lactamase superfamily II)
MQVIEGLYQLITPFPQFTYEQAREYRRDLGSKPRWIKSLPYVLPYLIRSRGETALVDNGWNTDSAFEALSSGMAEHDAKPTDIQQLIITHVHPDHFGLTGKLAEESGAKVLMHEREADEIDRRYTEPQPLVDTMKGWAARHGVPDNITPDMARGSMGMRQFVAAKQPDVRLTGDETITVGDFIFQVIWTPGHAPGHICLYEPNHKALLSGDHILPTITPNVSRYAGTIGSPLADYMASLEKVAKLDVDLLLPAHEFDTRDRPGRVAEIRAHHEERLNEMERCIGEGATAWDVAGRVKWATGSLVDFEPFMQRAAVGETLAHLEYLESLNRVRSHEPASEEGVITWTRA